MSIKHVIKSSIIFSKIYYCIGSILLNSIRLFIKPQKNLILFMSFGGAYYNDSPKAIYEAMIKDSRFSDCEFVWAFKNPRDTKVPGRAKVVKIDSFQYFIICLKAKVWISSSPVERRLNFKGKNTYYFCTWHGTPLKKIGEDAIYKRNKYDLLCAQGKYDERIFQHAFNMKTEKIICSGLPRNDVLAHNWEKSAQIKMKKKLQIPIEKKVLLYCPTFRDWKKDYAGMTVDLKKWKRKLGEDYSILFRSHSKVIKENDINYKNEWIIDVSNYHDINDLMIASDILITDYSSVMFDYSILERPIICYTYDYEEYFTKRGLYFDIRTELPGGSISEDELLNIIKNVNQHKEEIIRLVKKFKNRYVEKYGDATFKALNNIYENL